jgi:hybrid cluster-associated redox disulfide protein
MKKERKIKPNTPISEIIDNYPLAVDYLIDEYDFYCVNCIMSEFESLEEGCELHGIVDDDFIELLDAVNELV